MREIKFRIWDKNVNRMEIVTEMVYGDDGKVIDANSIIIKEEGILMQFTGLHDNNGKEIYEGDIVEFCVFDHNGKDYWYKGSISYGNASFGIDTNDNGWFDLGSVLEDAENIEVIGNVHENPKLL